MALWDSTKTQCCIAIIIDCDQFHQNIAFIPLYKRTHLFVKSLTLHQSGLLHFLWQFSLNKNNGSYKNAGLCVFLSGKN